MIGESVGNFTIIERLGKGGMGEVWLAEQKTVKTKVAIKVLLEDVSTDRDHVERFFNEAVAVSKIKHAGIAKIFDVGFHQERRAYLVMEFLEGEPLSARIRKLGRLPLTQVTEIGRQIASVLEATHSEGIIHRDLKPDNVYLIRDKELEAGERVKVLDFGIAKLGTGGITGTSGGSMGTPAYMSPEQWKHSAKVDGRADGYSLGCLLFEMATGRPPFLATSVGEACNMHLNDPPPLARSIVKSLPATLESLIQHLLAKRPEDRPEIEAVKDKLTEIHESAQTIADTLDSSDREMPRPVAIDAVTRAETDETVRPAGRASPDTTLGGSAATVEASAPPTKRSRLPIAIGAGVVAVAGGIAIITLRPGDQTKSPEQAPVADAAVVVAIDAAEPTRKGWVRVVPVDPPVELGIGIAKAPEHVRGFRKGRNVMSPRTAYSIQSYEVTWGDVETWLDKNPTAIPDAMPSWANDVKAREKLPVTGLTWSSASAYCRSIGARLPTEEEWEYAARGPALRPHPWGNAPIDSFQTHAFKGAGATPNPVGTNDQDRTPDRVFDLAGNVQEWTTELARTDEPSDDKAWAIEGDTTFRAIRGLPLEATAPSEMPAISAAYRQPYCSTGVCVKKSTRLKFIGFRCARDE